MTRQIEHYANSTSNDNTTSGQKIKALANIVLAATSIGWSMVREHIVQELLAVHPQARSDDVEEREVTAAVLTTQSLIYPFTNCRQVVRVTTRATLR